MLIIYNTSILLYKLAIFIAKFFNAKAQLFWNGRQDIWHNIQQQLQNETRHRVWIHCASLGEFEQGRPLIDKIKNEQPETCIILTFFSPSGYEIRKNYSNADYVFYLPLDTRSNANRFIKLIQPKVALFVKYEFWYHYLQTLYQHNIPTVLFSSIFQNRQPFFKWYGALHRKMLAFFTHIFVQDKPSVDLLSSINIHNVSIAGDTRFDRVKAIIDAPKEFHQVVTFKHDKKLLVAGSTWHDDEALLQQALQGISNEYKCLIVPHEIDPQHINQILQLFGDTACLWSDDEGNLKDKKVCIVNEMGHLSYLYRYADAAWVGGGFNKSGIHNIVEAAVYGIPVFIGPNYTKFREAIDLINIKGVASMTTPDELIQYLQNETVLNQMGVNAAHYVQQQLGATQIIFDYLKSEKCFLRTPVSS